MEAVCSERVVRNYPAKWGLTTTVTCDYINCLHRMVTLDRQYSTVKFVCCNISFLWTVCNFRPLKPALSTLIQELIVPSPWHDVYFTSNGIQCSTEKYNLFIFIFLNFRYSFYWNSLCLTLFWTFSFFPCFYIHLVVKFCKFQEW